MEIRIGVLHAPREVVIESAESVDDLFTVARPKTRPDLRDIAIGDAQVNEISPTVRNAHVSEEHGDYPVDPDVTRRAG